MKKISVFLLAAMMTASLAGCGASNSSSQTGSSVGDSIQSSVVESSGTEAESGALAGTGMKDGKTVEDFLAAVNELYSEMSFSDIDDAMLKDLYMVDPENVASYAGKLSMINVQAFDVLVVKAKEGKVEEVASSLEQRKQNRISEFEFYPVNNNDVNTKNALVLTSGDYAILVICDNYEGVQEILDEYFTF
ncbi:MAG: DUF4358 domain-containing protein [Oscillospiraceae bacterium]|nr:DUF4358 domain-containing protein [Oscillospiraceae bacterium]